MMHTAAIHPSLRNVLCEAYDVPHVCSHDPVATYRVLRKMIQTRISMTAGHIDKPFDVKMLAPAGNPFCPEVIFVCAKAKDEMVGGVFDSISSPRVCTACGIRYQWHDGESGRESHDALCEECQEYHGDVR